jgi:hypothetical protein
LRLAKAKKTKIMEIKIVEVTSRKLLRTFIHLPATLHRDEPNWMPTIYIDDWNFFNPKKNHQFDSCDTIMVIAEQKGKPVGRIMGIIHNTYNTLRNENSARFGYFDSIDNQEVAHALFTFIQDWVVQKGKTLLVGPYGFSDKDIQGLLIEGFDHLPLIDSACNPPYIIKLIENEGLEKEIDCMTYKFSANLALPELYYRIVQRSNYSNHIELIEFTSRKELKPYIIPVLQLVNKTYDHLYGFVPMSDTEIQELASRYLPIIDPRFVKLIEKEGEVIAFIVAIPNLSIGIQKSKGYLFPLGIFRILLASKKTRQLDLMLGAVRRDYQGTGLEVVMGISLIESARKADFKDMETHLILENNNKMRSEFERLKVPVYKRFRVFRKEI